MSGFLEFWPASRKMVPGLFVCLFDFVFIFYFNGDNKGLEGSGFRDEYKFRILFRLYDYETFP